MTITLLSLLLTAAFAAAPNPVRAPAAAPAGSADEVEEEEKAGPPAWMQACEADAKKLCAGNKNLFGCLGSRDTELAKGCKMELARAASLIKRVGGVRQTWNETCVQDQAKHCPAGVESSKPLLKCMRKHNASLTPACRKLVASAVQDWQKLDESLPLVAEMMSKCMEDQARLCPSSANSHGLDASCIESVRAKLSPRCRAFVDGGKRPQR